MSWWIITLICLAGYVVLSYLPVPLFVYDQLDQHKQFNCNDDTRICYINRQIIAEGDSVDKQRVIRKCSARYVQKYSLLLPIMILGVSPRLFAFSIVNRLENKDKKIRELEKQKKVSEEQQRNLLAEFDIVMTKLEEDSKAKQSLKSAD